MTNILLVDAYNVLLTLMHVKEKDVFWRAATDIKQIMYDLGISKVVMCCDAGDSKYRLSKYPEYKLTRREARAKEELEKPAEAARKAAFIKDAKEFIDLSPMFGFDVVKCPGIEADDIIAYFVQHTDLTTHRIAILSSDTDILQVIRPNVVQRSYSKKMKFKPLDVDVPPKVWVNTSRFIEVYGIEPKQWVHFKALAGDTSDNITSPEGLGEGGALKLIQKYGDIDTIFKEAEAGTLQIPRLAKKAKAALATEEGQAMVRRNVDIVSLLYTDEQHKELFVDTGWDVALDEVIDTLSEPPLVEGTTIKERMLEDGRVGLHHSFDEWVNMFRGANHI